MRKGVYRWMFGIGGLLSALILCDLLGIPGWLSTVFSFLAMLGGGVFCSALVSYLIEKQNEIREKKQKDAQRQYLLDAVKHGFMRLCEREMAELSCFYSNHVLGQKEKYRREIFPLETVGQNVCDLLSKIEQEEDRTRKENKEIIISLQSLEFEKAKKHHIISANKPYYDSLLKSLTSLSADFALFLSSGIFTEKDIDNMKALTSDVEDVIMFSSDIELDDGTILVIKKVLFEKTIEIMAALNIPTGTTFSCQYKPMN